MKERVFYELEAYLMELRDLKAVQSKRRNEIVSKKDIRLKRRRASNDRWYYYGHRAGDSKLKFMGSDGDNLINEIKEIRYLDKSLEIVCRNIDVVENALKKMSGTDYDSVNAMLPETYRDARIGLTEGGKATARKWKESAEAFKATRDVYRPEDLKVRTDDGSMVRSKSEGMIYNYLLSIGVNFVYELPMRINNRFVVPDFTILSEVNNKTEIIIEHQGMMDNEYYRNKFGEKVYMYLKAGFVQGQNIFYTFDNSDGGFDKRPIEMIVRNSVRPEA